MEFRINDYMKLNKAGEPVVIYTPEPRETLENGLQVAKHLMELFGFSSRNAQIVKGIIHDDIFFPRQPEPNSHVLMIFNTAVVPVGKRDNKKWLASYPCELDVNDFDIGQELLPSYTDGSNRLETNIISKDVATPTNLLDAILLALETHIVADFVDRYEELMDTLPEGSLIEGTNWEPFLRGYLYPCLVTIYDALPYLTEELIESPKLEHSWEELTVETPAVKFVHNSDDWTVFVRNSKKDAWVNTYERYLYSDLVWENVVKDSMDNGNIAFFIQRAVYALLHLKMQAVKKQFKKLLSA